MALPCVPLRRYRRSIQRQTYIARSCRAKGPVGNPVITRAVRDAARRGFRYFARFGPRCPSRPTGSPLSCAERTRKGLADLFTGYAGWPIWTGSHSMVQRRSIPEGLGRCSSSASGRGSNVQQKKRSDRDGTACHPLSRRRCPQSRWRACWSHLKQLRIGCRSLRSQHYTRFPGAGNGTSDDSLTQAQVC